MLRPKAPSLLLFSVGFAEASMRGHTARYRCFHDHDNLAAGCTGQWYQVVVGVVDVGAQPSCVNITVCSVVASQPKALGVIEALQLSEKASDE